MHATTENISVEREITIAASPETVWELLVDPSPLHQLLTSPHREPGLLLAGSLKTSSGSSYLSEISLFSLRFLPEFSRADAVAGTRLTARWTP